MGGGPGLIAADSTRWERAEKKRESILRWIGEGPIIFMASGTSLRIPWDTGLAVRVRGDRAEVVEYVEGVVPGTRTEHVVAVVRGVFTVLVPGALAGEEAAEK